MLIVLNHKINLNLKELIKYEKKLRNYKVVVMPQTPYMSLFTKGKYILGSQCLSEDDITGSVSIDTLVDLKVKYLLVGHYDRRFINKDTEQIINMKINACHKNKITPILCIGGDFDNDEKVIIKQIDNVFNNITNKEDIIIAYEPITFINSKKLLLPDVINKKAIYIKSYIKETYNTDNKVLYGGNVNLNNIEDLKKLKSLDGVLVGNASLDVNNVINMYRIVNK